MHQHARAAFRAETSLEFSAAIRVDGIIARFVGSDLKLIAVYPKECEKSTAARPLASPAMALVLKYGF